MTVHAEATLSELYAQCMGSTEGGARAISYEIILQVTTSASAMQQAELLLDAYSPTKNILLEHKSMQLMQRGEDHRGKITQRISTGMEAPPQGARVLATTANPLVTDTRCAKDSVEVQGILFCRCLCIDREGHILGLDARAPFQVSLDVPGMAQGMECSLNLQLEGLYSQLGGEELDIKATFLYSVQSSLIRPMSVVGEMHANEEGDLQPIDGILVYFVQGGETLWSLAKRYLTTVETILRFNPQFAERTLQSGDRVMLLRPSA